MSPAMYKWISVWFLVFAFGTVSGYVFYEQLLPQMVPIFEMGINVSDNLSSEGTPPYWLAVIIFTKNLSVALLCTLAGRATRGMFPTIVCTVNGAVIGFIAALFAATGVAVWKFALVLLPHGIFELSAIFAACAIGILAAGIREKMSMLRVPAALLGTAAVVETWISPVVVNIML